MSSIAVFESEAVVGAFDDADEDPAASLSMGAGLLLLGSSLRDFGCFATIDYPMRDLFASVHVVGPLAGHGPHVVQEGAGDDADIVNPGVEVFG